MSIRGTFGDGRGLLDQLVAMIRTDGLADLLAGFNDAGAEGDVESWVGSIENHATDRSTVERAIGRGRISAMATHLSTTPAEVADGLALMIPVVVDRITQGGAMPSGADLDALDAGELAAEVDLDSLFG